MSLTPSDAVQSLLDADAQWRGQGLFTPGREDANLQVLIEPWACGAAFLSVLKLWHESQSELDRQSRGFAPEPGLDSPRLTCWVIAEALPTAQELRAYWMQESTQEGVQEAPPSTGALNTVQHRALLTLLEHWPAPCPGVHHLELMGLGCSLWLLLGPRDRALAQLRGRVDGVRVGGDWTPKAPVPKPTLSASLASSAPHAQRLAPKFAPPLAVIGAGIAGACTALALCEQGFEVHLFDAADGPAQGASGNWAGAFHPHITRGDSPLSQLTRLGCDFTLKALQRLSAKGLLTPGVDWDVPGHLQVIPEEDHAHTQETLRQLGFPEQVVHWVEGTPSGLFFPQGGWVKPARWVEASLAACGPRLHTHYGLRVESSEHLLSALNSASGQGSWTAVVIAASVASPLIAGLEPGRSNAVKGQIGRYVRWDTLPSTVSGEAYAIAPPLEDWIVLGATYERPVEDLRPTAESDALNRGRFEATFPAFRLGAHLESRCALRYVWPDRLPVIGELRGARAVTMPRVFLNTAYASRGLSWAAMAAHLIASRLKLGGSGLELALTARLQPRGEWGDC